jgi:hypothetical protein
VNAPVRAIERVTNDTRMADGEMHDLPHHYESSAFIACEADELYAYLDDHARLSSHMSKSSWMMGGMRMEISFDSGRGQKVGSLIRLHGRVLGIELLVEEIVIERDPPSRKAWETTGTPKLLVIGHYRMGFELVPQVAGSLLRVYIDYALPERAPARWLSYIVGDYYAKWCTRKMVGDAAKQFAATA